MFQVLSCCFWAPQVCIPIPPAWTSHYPKPYYALPRPLLQKDDWEEPVQAKTGKVSWGSYPDTGKHLSHGTWPAWEAAQCTKVNNSSEMKKIKFWISKRKAQNLLGCMINCTCKGVTVIIAIISLVSLQVLCRKLLDWEERWLFFEVILVVSSTLPYCMLLRSIEGNCWYGTTKSVKAKTKYRVCP